MMKHFLKPSGVKAAHLCTIRTDQDRFSWWVRMWLLRRVDEENRLPHSEQRRGEVAPDGGDEGEGASAAPSEEA